MKQSYLCAHCGVSVRTVEQIRAHCARAHPAPGAGKIHLLGATDGPRNSNDWVWGRDGQPLFTGRFHREEGDQTSGTPG